MTSCGLLHEKMTIKQNRERTTAAQVIRRSIDAIWRGKGVNPNGISENGLLLKLVQEAIINTTIIETLLSNPIRATAPAFPTMISIFRTGVSATFAKKPRSRSAPIASKAIE